MNYFMIWLLILIGCRLTGQIKPSLDYVAIEPSRVDLIHSIMAKIKGILLP